MGEGKQTGEIFIMNTPEKILLSFVGNRDPYYGEEPGPVLSLLSERSYNRVFLFCTGPEYYERAKTLEEIMKGEGVSFNFARLDLDSVIDYEEIYGKLKKSLSTILARYNHQKPDISILLDPGTPQMQTSWFLLVRSGSLDARLLQGIPPRFAGGIYKVREIDLDESALPEVIEKKALPVDETAEEQDKWIQPDLQTRVIGDAPSFRNALAKALKAAVYDISVLLMGETGAGKEVFARVIHEASKRKDKPFIPINCAGITPALAESALFGHVKGAFTGADQARPGYFRTADGGTILLDEIGDLPKDLQPKLLRALENGTVIPVGSDREVTVNVRVIAATNCNLEKLIKQGNFRQDLYSRLQQLTIEIPPLRERQADIPNLVEVFLSDWNHRYREKKGFSSETMKLLLRYPWPENVRELSNAVTTLCAQGQGENIPADFLPPRILLWFDERKKDIDVHAAIPDEGMNLKAYIYRIEKLHYEEALNSTDWNMEQAAKLLGLNPPAFRKACRERFDLQRTEGISEEKV
jgi:DNA-binding NtrC family response regulator